jgi:adenine-specific DNA-methyltransferase
MTQQPTYGPHNPHPLSQMRRSLVWEGKHDEYGQRREVDIAGCTMPFASALRLRLQQIEGIDEPFAGVAQPWREAAANQQLTLFEQQNPRVDDLSPAETLRERNRLVRQENQRGDNKLVMAALMRSFKGKVDLIDIDPTFDVGADFSMSVSISPDTIKTFMEAFSHGTSS